MIRYIIFTIGVWKPFQRLRNTYPYRKAILPALGNEFIILLKDTSLLNVIGGKELVYAANGIMNRTWEQMFPLMGVALIYLVLVMIFTWLQGRLERRLRQSDRR